MTVPWQDYAPEITKDRIDALYALGDCNLLQQQFASADRDDDVMLNRAGHDNTALKKYIDTGLQQAGCKGPVAPDPTQSL